MSISLSAIFLMSVLVLGVLSYPLSLPNLDQDIGPFDFQPQLGNVAFADEDDDDEENGSEEDEEDAMEDAADAIADANEEIEKADEKIAEASDKGKETSLAEQQLEEAIAKRDMAQESFDSENFDEAEELAEEAEDLANEARGKLIGKTQEDLEEDEDELEFEGIIASIGSNSFTLEGFLEEIFVNDETEFDEGFDSLSDLMPGFHVDVDVILSNSSLVATEIEIEEEEEAEDEEELEGVIISVNQDGSFTIETEDGTFTIFTDEDTEFDDFDSLNDLIPGFGVEVEVVLSNSSLVATEIEIEDEEEEEEAEEEIEIEVEVEDGVAKIKVEFDDQKHRFVIDFTDEDSLADAILLEVPDLPLSTSQIMSIWDLDIEEEDENMSSITMHEHEEEAMQTALDLIYELQQKIEQLEANIQTLLEKYESGAYFGTVPEVDSEIKSYTITFDGSATSIDDESIVDAQGQIFIENLLTINDNILKFRVTGGEISIDNTFYDIVFGKARVSSSGPSGEKDSVVLLGQVIDFADEDDDSSTLKLVINSETSLEGDFGLDPISIEILPQSKIAGQWYLSGSGQLSLLEG